MIGYTSGQDGVMMLARNTRCPTTEWCSSFIDQPCLVKMAGQWLRSVIFLCERLLFGINAVHVDNPIALQVVCINLAATEVIVQNVLHFFADLK